MSTEPPSRKTSNASTLLNFADALDGGSYERRHVPVSPEFFYLTDDSTTSLTPLISTPPNLDPNVHSRLSATSSRSLSSTSLRTSYGESSPLNPHKSLHVQQSFSDARRAMEHAARLRESDSNASGSNRNSAASSGSDATDFTVPATPGSLESTNHSDSSLASGSLRSRESSTKLSIPRPPPIPEDTVPNSIGFISRQPSRAVLEAAKKQDPTKPRFRDKPQIHNFAAPPTAPALMHWSRAPVHGWMPTHGLKSHTTALVDTTAWIFAGTNEHSQPYNDVWCLDLETFAWSYPKMQGEPPPACRAHSATVVRDQIVVFGGGDGAKYFNHLYILDTAHFRWTQYHPVGVLPPPRRAHSAILHDSVIYVFGGGTGNQPLGDLWALDVEPHPDQWQWVCLRVNPYPLHSSKGVLDDVYQRALVDDRGGPGPSPRGYHSANIVNTSMVVVGGSNGSTCYSDIWVLDLETRVWKEINTDQDVERPRLLAHTATKIGSFLFVVGGHNTNKYTDDVRMLNLQTLRYEAKPVAGRVPEKRAYHGALYFDHRLFIIGGFNGKEAFCDVRVLDLAAQSYLIHVIDFKVDQISEEEWDEGDEEGTEGGYYVS